MEELRNLLRYVLYTGHLKREKPVSLLIIAKTESGKTACIDMFSRESEGVVYMNDATPYGIVKELYRIQGAGREVNHIVIPDLLNPLSKTRASVQGFIHFFNSAMEEGVTKIETASIQYNIPTIQCGLVTAITKEAFNRRRRYWSDVGFLRRMLPFTYRYPIDMAIEILDGIFEGNHLEIDKGKLVFPKEKVEIKLSSDLAKKMYPYTSKLAQAEDVYGFTFQKHFQRLLKGVALSKGKSVVDIEDVRDLQKSAKYMNLEFNEME